MTNDDPMGFERERAMASAWFRSLRDEICQAFEQLEEEADPLLYDSRPGRFEFTPWKRSETEDQGGGEGGIMKGRLFEKVGVHISTVHGAFGEQFRAARSRARRKTRASGPAASRSSRICAIRVCRPYI